jgi:thiopurine S-methyltransferase
MHREFWLNRWAENQIGFHLKGVNPHLIQFWSRVAGETKGRTLVPLCGKSEDLRWLAERGHEVVGVELSLIAAKAFAAEQGMVFVETHEPLFTVLRGTRITLYVGDFFDFTPAIGGRFDLFYDRAALVALPSELRPAYVQHLASLVAERAEGLLVDLEYDPLQMHGPPYTVSEAEVRGLFRKFHCEKLLEIDILEEEPHFKSRGLTWLKEAVYRLKRPGGVQGE